MAQVSGSANLERHFDPRNSRIEQIDQRARVIQEKVQVDRSGNSNTFEKTHIVFTLV